MDIQHPGNEPVHQAHYVPQDVGDVGQQNHERQHPRLFPYHRNRGRGPRGRNSRGGKHRPGNQPAYASVKLSNSLMVVPERVHFPVYVSNAGLPVLCRRVYDLLETRDHRLADHVNRDLLTYIVGLAWLNRMAQIAVRTSNHVPPEVSLLKASVGGLFFPPIICDYIESFGTYTCSNGANIMPRVGDIDTILFTAGGALSVYDHRPTIVILGHQVPENNHWGIVPALVAQYVNGVARSNRTGMVYRTVNNDLVDGQSAMLCSHHSVQDMTIGWSSQLIADQECQLGAAYMVRDYAERAAWPGDYNHLISPSFSSRQFRISELIGERVISLMIG
jgi:hypothetical protein